MIKTIGDAYMAVCGLPNALDNHALRTVKAAKEMIAFLDQLNSQHPQDPAWQVRIGINTGEVVAGVIGDYKFCYDVWGDTVNMASRLETNSSIGKVNVSEDSYHHIKQKFNCTSRGEIEVKNKGKLRMYFVEEEILK
jgi:class 3 adenylate cyclase